MEIILLDNQNNIEAEATVYPIDYIPDYVKAEQERRENEAIRISNETTRQENELSRIALYDDLEYKKETDYWRGDKGDTGATPVITANASVTSTVGTPSVVVTKTGTDEAPTISFAFSNLKGDKGDPGAIKFEVVAELPTTEIKEDTIYLVPITPDTSGNNYAEYIYVNGQWELLGKIGVQVDLSGYATIDYVNGLVGDINDALDSINNEVI
jgi:hypothetical protein